MANKSKQKHSESASLLLQVSSSIAAIYMSKKNCDDMIVNLNLKKTSALKMKNMCDGN